MKAKHSKKKIEMDEPKSATHYPSTSMMNTVLTYVSLSYGSEYQRGVEDPKLALYCIVNC
jgi:hypothetical protein